MELDKQALEVPQELRIAYYTWPPKSISLGCLFDPERLLNLEAVKEEHWTLYSRVSGGGAMFHGGDICFSLVVPQNHFLFAMSVLDSYKWVHEHLAKALTDLYPDLKGKFSLVVSSLSGGAHHQSCCLIQPTAYDLLLEGKKVAGCAQRRRKSLVHQISLSLQEPKWEVLKKLFRQHQDIDTIMRRNYTALDLYIREQPEQIGKKLSQSLAKALSSFSDSCASK
jgi:lipoate-protein ligase A